MKITDREENGCFYPNLWGCLGRQMIILVNMVCYISILSKHSAKADILRFSPEAAYNYGVDNCIHGDDFAIVTI